MAENLDDLYSNLSSDERFKVLFGNKEEFEQYLASDPTADKTMEDIFDIKSASEYLKKKDQASSQNLAEESSSSPSLSAGPIQTETETTEVVEQPIMGVPQDNKAVEAVTTTTVAPEKGAEVVDTTTTITEPTGQEAVTLSMLEPLGYGKGAGVGPQTTKPPGKKPSDIIVSTGTKVWNKDGKGIHQNVYLPLYSEIEKLSKTVSTDPKILEGKLNQFVSAYKELKPDAEIKSDFDFIINQAKTNLAKRNISLEVSAEGAKIAFKKPEEKPITFDTGVVQKGPFKPRTVDQILAEKNKPVAPTEKDVVIAEYLDANDRFTNNWKYQFGQLTAPGLDQEFAGSEYLSAKLAEQEPRVDKIIQNDVNQMLNAVQSNLPGNFFDSPALVTTIKSATGLLTDIDKSAIETKANPNRRLLWGGPDDDRAGLYMLDDANNVKINPIFLEEEVDRYLKSSKGPITPATIRTLNEKRKASGLDEYTRDELIEVIKPRFVRLAKISAQQKLDSEIIDRKMADVNLFKEDVVKSNLQLSDDIKNLTKKTEKLINDYNIHLVSNAQTEVDKLAESAKQSNQLAFDAYKVRVQSNPMMSPELQASEYQNYLKTVNDNATAYEEQANAIKKQADSDLQSYKLQIQNSANSELEQIKKKYGIVSDKDEKGQMTTAAYRKYRDAYRKEYDNLKKQENMNSDALGLRLTDIVQAASARMFGNSIESLTAAVGYEDNPLTGLLKYLDYVQVKSQVNVKPFSKVLEEQGLFSGEAFKSIVQNAVQQVPTLAAGVAASALSGNPFIGGGIMFAQETTDQVGENYKTTFERTGSLEKAENAAAETLETQIKIAPLYTISMLPFTKGFLSKIAPGTGFRALGLKAGAGIALELTEEVPIEIAQNYLSYKFGTDNPESFSSWVSQNGLNTAIDVLPTVAVLGGSSAIMENYREKQTEQAKSRVMATLGRLGMVQNISDAAQVVGSKGVMIIPEYLYRTGQISDAELKDMRRAFEDVVKELPNAQELVKDQDAQKYYVTLATEKLDVQRKIAESKDENLKKLLEEKVKSIDKKLADVAAGKPLQITKITFKDGGTIVADNSQMQSYIKNPKFLDDITEEGTKVESSDSNINKVVEETKKQKETQAQEATDKGTKQLAAVETTARETGATIEEQEKLNAIAEKARQSGQKNVDTILDEASTLQRALNEIAPGAKIVFLNNDDYVAAMQQVKGRASSAGNFAYRKNEDGTYSVEVQINLDKATSTTLAHEVGHGILLRALGSDPKLFNDMRTRLKKTIQGTIRNESLRQIEALVDKYNNNEKGEEFLVELAAILKQSEKQMEIATLEKIAKVIADFVAYVTGGKVQIFDDIRTRADYVDFVNGMVETLRTGQIAQGVQKKIDATKAQPAAEVTATEEVVAPQTELTPQDFAKKLNPNAKTIVSVTGEKAYNYTNEDGVEVSIAEDKEGGVINDEEVQADILLDYIGNKEIEKRGKGLASKELDKIISEADKNDKSIAVIVDSKTASKGGGTIGLNNEELKKWYQSKGFIFTEGEGFMYGYRPKTSEDITKLQAKPEKQILVDGVDFNELSDKFPRLSSIADSLIKTVNNKKEVIDAINKEYESRQISKLERDEFLNELNKIKTLEVKVVRPTLKEGGPQTEAQIQDAKIEVITPNNEEIETGDIVISGYVNPSEVQSKSQLPNVFQPVDISWTIDPQSGISIRVPEERKTMYDVVSESGGAIVVANSDGTGIGKVVDNQILQGGIGYSFIEQNIADNIGFAASDDAKIPSIWEAAQAAAKFRDAQNPEMAGSPVAVFVMVQEPGATFGNAYAATYFGNVLKSITKDKGYQTSKAKSELIEFINDFRTNNDYGRKYNDAFAELISIIRNTDFTKPESIDKITNILITEKKRGLPNNAAREIIAQNNKRFGFDVRRAFFQKFFVGTGKANSSQPANELRNYLKQKGFSQENFYEKYVDENIMKSLQGETPGKRLEDGGFAMTGFFIDPNVSKEDFVNNSKQGTYQHKQFNSKFNGINPFVLNGKYYVNEMLPEARFVSKEGKEVPVQVSAAMSLYPRTRKGQTADIIERARVENEKFVASKEIKTNEDFEKANQDFGIEDGKVEFKSKSQYTPKELSTLSETISNRFDQTQLENLKGLINPGVTAPQNTTKAYKLFKVKRNFPGELFPLFVGANESVTTGEWIQAKAGELTQTKEGKTMVKSTLGPLAYRPGWHSGEFAIATHIGNKKNVTDKAPNLRADDQVWAEVEVGNDFDWQTEANNRAEKTKDGKISPRTAHITDQIPLGGNYKYKTNSNMTGSWIISGEMKVNRILTDAEVEQINKESGSKDLPRTKPFDFAAFGFNQDGTVSNPKQVLSNQIARAYLNAKETGTNQELIDAVDMKAPETTGEFKSKSQLDFTQIRPEYDAIINQTNGDKVAAYTGLVEKGYTPRRIKEAIGLYDFDETALKQAQSNIAINTMDKVGTAFSDRQELIKQEINNNLGNVEAIYGDLIDQGYSNLEIFTAARDMDFLSPQDLIDIFGADYRQTVQNALNRSTEYPADFLDELEAEAQNLKVTQKATEVADIVRNTGVGLVDSAVAIEFFLDYLKSNGFDQIAIALSEGVKQFANDRGMLQKAASWTESLANGEFGDKLYTPEAISHAFNVSSELFSQAGRILQLARFFNETNQLGMIEKQLARAGVALTENQRKTLEALINDFKAAQKDNKAKREALEKDWSDQAYEAFWDSEKAVGIATIKIAQFLEARKPIFWNERITSGSARALLNISTTILSFVANIENNIWSTNFAARSIQKLRDFFGSGIKGNTLSISNWQMARKLTSDRMWFDMNRNAKYGVLDTNRGLNRYYDNLAQVNFFKDAQWAYNFMKAMTQKVMNKDFESMTPEEQADAFDLTLTKLKDGTIELRDGKTYTLARSLAWTLGTGPILAGARANPFLLFNTGGPIAAEVTGRAMAYGGDIAFGYMAAQRAMIDYFQNIQGTRFQNGVFDSMLADANGNLDQNALRAMSQILYADAELYARFETEGLKRTLLANNVISGGISLGRGTIRKKIRGLYQENRVEIGGPSFGSELKRQFSSKGLKKNFYQLADVGLFTLMPFTKVPVNFLGSAIMKVVPAASLVKYISSEITYQYKWNEFKKQYSIGVKLKSEKQKRDYEKAKIDLFFAKRQATYDAAQAVTSVAIYSFAMSAVKAGAILTGGGDDPEKEKALKKYGLRGGLYNATLHWEYLASQAGKVSPSIASFMSKDWKKDTDNFLARRGGYAKEGDVILNTRNAGFLGYAFNAYGTVYDKQRKEENDNTTRLFNEQTGAITTMLTTALSSGIEDLPMFSGLARLGQVMTDLKSGESSKKAFENFASGTLSTSMAVFFPSFFSFMSKGNAEFVQSANDIVTLTEKPDWSAFWGPIPLRVVQKLNRNISFNEETRNEFYDAAIGPFGEDLGYKVTLAEPGTAGAYIQAIFDPFSFRRFSSPAKEQQKEIQKYRQSMDVHGGMINLALIYQQMTGRDYDWTPTGKTNGMFGTISNPMKNNFTYTQERTLGGDDAANVYKGFEYQLPNDLYRQELKERGEFFRSSLEKYGTLFKDVLAKVQTYVDQGEEEKAKTEIVNIFNTYQDEMLKTKQNYMNMYRNTREKNYLIEMKKRNLFTPEEIQKMINIGLANRDGLIL